MFVKFERIEGFGFCDVGFTGRDALISFKPSVFRKAAESDAMRPLLKKVNEVAAKCSSCRRIMVVTAKQHLMLEGKDFPFEESGCSKFHVVELEHPQIFEAACREIERFTGDSLDADR